MKITRNVGIVESITRKTFEENYFNPQKPVVLRGLLKESPAMTKWNFPYFKEILGNLDVGIFDESFEKNDRSYKDPHYKMPFTRYLDELAQGPIKKRLFLFNPFKYHPALLQDFEFPKICSGFLKSFPFMFFGGDGAVTRIHQDMDMSCVFLTQFEGKKRVVLFDPRYSDLLYRLPMNVHTSVNINEPDYEKYPGLAYVEGQEVILEHGDTLFMPAGWWHHIEYIGSGFGMSMRCLSPHIRDILNGSLRVGVLTHLDELLLKMASRPWYHYKNQLASQRANRKIKKLQQLVG